MPILTFPDLLRGLPAVKVFVGPPTGWNELRASHGSSQCPRGFAVSRASRCQLCSLFSFGPIRERSHFGSLTDPQSERRFAR